MRTLEHSSRALSRALARGARTCRTATTRTCRTAISVHMTVAALDAKCLQETFCSWMRFLSLCAAMTRSQNGIARGISSQIRATPRSSAVQQYSCFFGQCRVGNDGALVAKERCFHGPPRDARVCRSFVALHSIGNRHLQCLDIHTWTIPST
jgi:hypothetical protein